MKPIYQMATIAGGIIGAMIVLGLFGLFMPTQQFIPCTNCRGTGEVKMHAEWEYAKPENDFQAKLMAKGYDFMGPCPKCRGLGQVKAPR